MLIPHSKFFIITFSRAISPGGGIGRRKGLKSFSVIRKLDKHSLLDYLKGVTQVLHKDYHSLKLMCNIRRII